MISDTVLDYSILLSLATTPYVPHASELDGTAVTDETIRPNEADDDPHRLARINLESYANDRDGRRLVYWRDEWYTWRGTHYRKITEKDLRAKVTYSVKKELDRLNIRDQIIHRQKINDGKIDPDTPPPTVKKVTTNLITNILLNTSSMEGVKIPVDVETMSWLPTRERKSWVACLNGIIDIDAVIEDRDDYLHEHTPDWFSMTCLPYNFDPKAECPRWEAFLERNLELDPERIKQLQEWAGYCLLPDTGLQKFMVLEGEGANGKSVYCAAIQAMLGSKNVSTVALELFGDKFELTPTLDRLVNICGDAGELDKVAEGHIKSFTSGNTMSFGRKYLEPIERQPTARLMMAVNNRPRFSDKTDGIWRRMLLVPWNIQIPVQDRIPNMDKAWWWEKTGELPGILLWAIKGLYRLRQQGQFTRSVLCDEALQEYRTEMNPAQRFLLDHFEESETSRIQCHLIYSHYVNWAKENGHHRPMAEQQFGREVMRTFKKCRKSRPHENGSRAYFYNNIAFSVDRICGNDVTDKELF